MIFKYRRAWGGLVWGPGIICWNPAGEPEVQLLSSCAEHRASLPLTPPATPSSPLCLSLSQNTPQDPLYPFRGLFALLWMSLSFPVLFSFSWISNHLSKSLLHFCEVSPRGFVHGLASLKVYFFLFCKRKKEMSVPCASPLLHLFPARQSSADMLFLSLRGRGPLDEDYKTPHSPPSRSKSRLAHGVHLVTFVLNKKGEMIRTQAYFRSLKTSY